MMTYPEALEHLFQRQEHSSKLSLETLTAILEHLPFPPNAIPGIQVGGTNGKGSTCHFLAAMLQEGGHKVGLFTSPHLQTVRERIAVQGAPISPHAFASAYSQAVDLSERLLRRGILQSPPTFFESVFLTALYAFQEAGVSLIVWEVGLGGRLDATTALHPVLHLITNISLEHTRILGRTLGQIAQEKAGMIKPGVPVLCGSPPRTVAFRQIRRKARERGAPFVPLHHRPDALIPSKDHPHQHGFYQSPEGRTLALSPRMAGEHQLENAALAVLATEILSREGHIAPLSPSILLKAMQTVQVPGRVELLHPRQTPPVILDGGHNLEGIRALIRTLTQQKTPPLTLVFGVLGDKSYRKMVQTLLPACARAILLRPDSHRALPPEKLVPLFAPHLPTTIASSPQGAWAQALESPHPILITGSLYLAGTFRNLLLGEAL